MEEPEEIRLIPVTVLTPHTRQVLSMNLNPLSETIIPGCDKVGDYRGLAELLNKSYSFIQGLDEKRDPTGELLKSLQGREATLTRLWECLKQLGRVDVLEKCRELFIQDTKRWHNRKPRNRTEAEEIKLERRRKDIKKFFDGDENPKTCHETPPVNNVHTAQPHTTHHLPQQLQHPPKASAQPQPQASAQPQPQASLQPQPHVSSCTEVKQEKKGSKIKAFFRIKFLPHSNPPKSPLGDDQTRSHCTESQTSRNNSKQTSVNGFTDDQPGHSRRHNNKLPNGSASMPVPKNGTVRDVFSSLPSMAQCSDTDSSTFSSLSRSATSSGMGDLDTASTEGYKSSLPEPLLTIEDDECHKAMFDAYINSSEEDLLKAKEMLRILEAPPHSLRLFLPERQLMPGGSMYEDMAGVVEERCHGKVVIILTRHYQNSEACHFVTNFARALDPAAQKKQIIPVEYEKIQLPRMLKGMHVICKERDEQRGWFWKKLTMAIKQL